MKVKRLIVQNFKSYKNAIIDRIFVGENGHGKSNIHIALLFLFSDLYSTESAQTKREALFEGLPVDSEVYVEALVDNSEKLFPGEDSELLLRKTITKDNKLIWRVNDRLVSGTEYDTLLELAGMKKSNPPNFILQGRVKRISQTDEVGLYTLLEEIIGTRTYEERKNESKELLDSVVIDERKAHEMLEDFRGKLHEIQIDKQDYKKYEQDLEAGNLIYHSLYSRKVQSKNQKRLEVDKIIEGKRSAILELRQDQFNLSNQLSSVEENITEHQVELENLDSAVNELTSEIQKYERVLKGLKQDAEISGGIDKETSQKDLNKKKAEAEKQREATYKSLVGLQKELKQIQANLELCKLKREQLLQLRGDFGAGGVKEVLKKKQEQTAIGIKSRSEELKFEQSELERYNNELRQHTKSLEDLEKQDKDFTNQQAKIMDEIRRLEAAKSDFINSTVSSKYSLAAAKDRAMELQTQVDELRKKVEVSGDINLSGLLRLMDELRNGAVEGVHGILIDLFEISSKIVMPTDMLIPASSLFGVVVKDEEVARQVDKINKALRGPRIRIFPLTWMQEEDGIEERTYPDKREKAIIIQKYIQPKPAFADLGLQPLINFIFGGNLVVETLKDAHNLASKYDCNCITFDNQIVYANSFITHLGYRDQKDSHLKKYLEFRAKHQELLQLKSSLANQEQMAELAKEKQLESVHQIAELKMAKEKLRIGEEQHQNEIQSVRKVVLQLRKLVQETELKMIELESDLSSLESELAELKSNKSAFKIDKFDEKVLKETEAEFQSLSDKLKTLLEKVESETKLLMETDLLCDKLAEELRGAHKGQQSQI